MSDFTLKYDLLISISVNSYGDMLSSQDSRADDCGLIHKVICFGQTYFYPRTKHVSQL